MPSPSSSTYPHASGEPIVAREVVDHIAGGAEFVATNFDETMFIMETGSLEK